MCVRVHVRVCVCGCVHMGELVGVVIELMCVCVYCTVHSALEQ